MRTLLVVVALTSIAVADGKLAPKDRDLYQRVISVLKKEYGSLGHSEAEFRHLASKSDCLTNALAIRTPTPGLIGRPQLESVVEISDLEAKRGHLIKDLSEQKDTNEELHKLADHVKEFLEVSQSFTWSGLFKAFYSVGKEKVGDVLKKELKDHAFNHLYAGYDAAGGDLGKMDLVQATSPYWTDWKSCLGHLITINETAQLGWSQEQINQALEGYLRDRFKTEHGGKLDPWRIGVKSPEDEMENMFRDGLHAIKDQLQKELAQGLPSECFTGGDSKFFGVWVGDGGELELGEDRNGMQGTVVTAGKKWQSGAIAPGFVMLRGGQAGTDDNTATAEWADVPFKQDCPKLAVGWRKVTLHLDGDTLKMTGTAIKYSTGDPCKWHPEASYALDLTWHRKAARK